MERAVAAEKAWGMVRQLPPSIEIVDAYEVQLRLYEDAVALEGFGRFLLKGHLERDGTIILVLWRGATMLRRGHIGKGHQEPDKGPYIDGPHVHFPTTSFQYIEGRRAKNRVYAWAVPRSISLWDAVTAFAAEINLTGVPTEQQRRLPGG